MFFGFFFFKQKTAYEMRISDWSSDVCSSDLAEAGIAFAQLDAYVCGVGPGSFAGVRIGVSFVKGLALAHERPVVAVSSLAMLAAPEIGRASCRERVCQYG